MRDGFGAGAVAEFVFAGTSSNQRLAVSPESRSSAVRPHDSYRRVGRPTDWRSRSPGPWRASPIAFAVAGP
jgi:hypothetical protein